MSSRFEFEQWVGSAIERVFLFFANPQNLPRIMPPSTGTKLVEMRLVPPPTSPQVADVSGLAGVGSEIVTWFRVTPVLPVRAEWTALITEFEWNHHFADIQKKGPLKYFHHRHEFWAEMRDGVNGTRVRDLIDCEVGFGAFGEAAMRLFVSRELRKAFLYRQQALVNLLAV